jgi:hypothetical protein
MSLKYLRRGKKIHQGTGKDVAAAARFERGAIEAERRRGGIRNQIADFERTLVRGRGLVVPKDQQSIPPAVKEKMEAMMLKDPHLTAKQAFLKTDIF